MNQPVPRLAELARQVSESSNRLVDLARAAGHPDLGDLLVAAAKRWPDTETTVLVAGEAGSGKSSLINALIGRLDPPLLPMGDGVTLLRSAAVDEVRLHRPGAAPTVLHPSEVAEHREPDTTVEVLVADPRHGEGIVLVDTPSMGGPGSGARAVIGALAAAADAVIVSTTAEAPLTSAELDVLQAVRQRAGLAVAVVTHVDRSRGWRTICDESEASARRRDPDLLAAPPLPFALPLAQDALAEADPDEAAALADESGLAAVEAVLATIRERSRHVRLAGLVHAAVDVADRLAEDLGPPPGPDRRAALIAERDRLRQRSRTVTVDFADGCSILRDAIGVDIGREVQALLESVETDLDEHRSVDALVDSTWAHLDALRLRADTRIDDALDQLTRDAIEGISEDEDGERHDATKEEGRRSALASKASKVTTALRLRLLQAAVSTSGGGVLLYAVANPTTDAALRGGAMGISMLIGGIGAAEGFREARQQRTLNDARTRVRSVVEQWRSEYLAAMRERLLRQQRERERMLRDAIDGALRDVEAELGALDRPAADAAQPAAVAAQVSAVRTELDQIQRHLHAAIRLA